MSTIVKSIIIAAVYFSEALIVHSYADYIFTPKRNKTAVVLAYAVGFTTHYFVFLFNSNVIVNAVSYFLFLFLIFGVTYYCQIIFAAFHSLILTSAMVVSEMIAFQIVALFVKDYLAYTYRPAVLMAVFVISKLIYLVFCLVTSRKITRQKEEGILKSRLMILMCAQPVASILIATIILYICVVCELPMLLQYAVSFCLCILLLTDIYIVYVYRNTEKVNRENLSMKLAMLKDESDAEYYKMLQEQYNRQRILVHDVKNHMQVIDSLAADGKCSDIQSYIEKWGFDKAFQKQSRYCDNGILNIIVSKLAKDCEENDIDFHCDIRDKSVDFIDDVDISALFGNLLSNAFDAAKASEEKIIELDIKVKPTQNTTIIKITNSCKDRPRKTTEGLFISHKKDKEKHGLGQKSIARIIRKYNGQAENYYDDEKNQFEWMIILYKQS